MSYQQICKWTQTIDKKYYIQSSGFIPLSNKTFFTIENFNDRFYEEEKEEKKLMSY